MRQDTTQKKESLRRSVPFLNGIVTLSDFRSPDSLQLIIVLAVAVASLIWLWRRQGGTTQHGSLLAFYSRDLTKLAREGKLDPVIGRYRELSRLIQILSRRMKNNPILVGKSGIGKTAIVEQLANLVAEGRVPEALKNKHIFQLDLAALVAGTKYRGEFEKRLQSIVDEIRAAHRDIILFIDEVHILAEAGEATGAISASDILKPALARGELQAIGATTMVEYQLTIEKDRTLKRRFQTIIVDESTAGETRKILDGLRPKYEEFHHVRITDGALDVAVQLTNRLIPGRHFPDKAIDAVDEASAKVHLESTQNEHGATPISQVTRKDVEDIIHAWHRDEQLYSKVARPTASLLHHKKQKSRHS